MALNKDRGIFHKMHKIGTSHKNFLLQTAVRAVLTTETTFLVAKDTAKNIIGNGDTEYRNRGIIHGLHKVGIPSKNILMRAAVKTVLAAETTALFAKDVITNPFVGKEFHIKLERRQSRPGKFKTHIKLIRVEAPINKSHGIFHKVSEAKRFVEGDVANRGKKSFARKLTHSVLLTSEKAVIETGAFAVNRTWKNLKNKSNTIDTGKALMASLTTLQTINSGRKYLINYRKKRKNYLNLKQTYNGHKGKLRSLKKIRKADRKELKQYRKERRDFNKCCKVDRKSLKEWYGSNKKGFNEADKKLRISRNPTKKVNKINVKFQKKSLKYDKKNIKNIKKLKKISKYDKKRAKVIPIAALPLVPVGAAAKQITASSYQKIVNEVPENDFMQGIDKSYRVGKATIRSGNKIVTKLHDKNIEAKRSKIHKRENKLQIKTDKAKKKRKKKIDNSSKKFSEKAKEAAKRAAKSTVKAVADFAKFAFKFLGIILVPVIGIVLTVSIILLILTGGAGNSSYILGTYNAEDRYISYAVEHYTKIAYDFNEKILRCGTDDWKNALNDLGVDTSEFTEDPNNFYFGRSRYFSGTPSYDFDFDKLAAFMCAYYYEYDDEGNIQNWEWNNDYDEVLQQLFDTEYEFKSYYENRSYWKELNNYSFYAGGGSSENYWTIYEEDFSKNRMKIRSAPNEIKSFCKDGYLHYDYNTLEVLDANNDDKKTGYFIQDQRYIVRDPSGVVNYPFYSTKDVEYSEVNRYYRNGSVYYNVYGTRGAVVDFNDHETLYWIHDINSSPLQYYKFVWKHGVDGRGIPIFEDRTGYYWTSDYKQIYCVVNPADTHKWNGELEDICLVNFYKKNEWVTVCNLYYTVEKKCSFETAIEKVLKSKDEDPDIQAGRIEFYKILTQENENGRRTYGNHQMFPSPVSKSLQELIDDNEIYHGYGYDIQEWNTKHCEGLNDKHLGMDIVASNGTEVYAMFDGYVDWINEGNNTISIKSSERSNYWYDDNRNTEVIFSNVEAMVEQGANVVKGQVIGKVTDYKHCYDNWDIQASKNYLHIEIKIEYPKDFPGIGYEFIGVDPRFLIYHDNPEEE